MNLRAAYHREPRLFAWLALALALSAAPAAPAQAPPADRGAAGLVQRQQAIHERMTRLESTMLKLSRSLGASEPEKAERVRDALEQAGKLRLRSRFEEVSKFLADGRLSEADRGQATLLADLDNLLKLLTSPLNELDARRAERQRLEALKRSIRRLIEEQTENLYRTQHAEQRMQAGESESGSGATPESAELARKLEQAQRETHRKTADVQRDLRGKEGDGQPPRPGAESMEKAGENMRQAADKLGENKPGDARADQKEALERLQDAVDELDDALRQVRKEEIEETLAAMEARLQSMLAHEKAVRDALTPLAGKSAGDLSRTEQMKLSEAAEAQQQALDECESAVRLVVDEGTTVLLPELLRQVSQDMQAAQRRLARQDASDTTRRIADDVIAALEEMLKAVEKGREKQAEENPPDGQQQQQQEQQQSLLPKSAELKMMRSAQLRINDRMPDSEARAVDEPGRAELAALAGRQRQLSDLARRMYERK